MGKEIQNDRNRMLNFFKGIACIGVVFIHITFPGMFGAIISKSSQFATPLFFMIAGYYAFGRDESVIYRRLKKIIRIFLGALFCFFLYNLIIQIKHSNILPWLEYALGYKSVIKAVVFCTIDYAFPLWYLVAMIETYLLWKVVVRSNNEQKMIKITPILFLLFILLTVVCETNNYEWFWKVNFVTKALPWFVFGYYASSREKYIRYDIKIKQILFLAIVGLVIALTPIAFDTSINFSAIGLIPYSISLFLIGVKYPAKSISRIVEYIGDILSLNIYIFHVIIADIIGIVVRKLLDINTAGKLFQWLYPFITLICTIGLALILELIKAKKDKY